MLPIFVFIAIIFIVLIAALLYFVKKNNNKNEYYVSHREQIEVNSLKISELEQEDITAPSFQLICQKGSLEGKVYPIRKFVVKIGRHSTDGRVNDIEFPIDEKTISRKQSKVIYNKNNGRYYLINESDSPLFVNNEEVIKAFPLREGDSIDFGGGNSIFTFTVL